MTNTPVTVGWGTSVAYFTKTTTKINKIKVLSLLDLVGQVDEVKSEKYINSFTGLFGSGPAYLFLLLEIWSDLAKKHGFKHGEDMAVQTMLGSDNSIVPLIEFNRFFVVDKPRPELAEF